MLRRFHSRRSACRLMSIYGFVIVAVLMTLSLVRSTPPPIIQAHAGASWDAPHPHRLSFEREATDWAAPTGIFLAPPLQFSEIAVSPTELLLPIPSKGLHYNRPPPAV